MDAPDPADLLRRAAGLAAAALVQDGQTLGYGTGRAVTRALEFLALRVKDGLHIRGVPTSVRTAETCRALGLPLVSLDEVDHLDLVLDGADEVDPQGQVLKGGGGALTREKHVALAARERVLVFEAGKCVSHLGATRGLPIEVLSFGWRQTLARIAALLPGVVVRRGANGAPATSDGGGYLCDAPLAPGADLRALARNLKQVVGVVEHGLFLDLAPTLVIGTPEGAQVVRPAASQP